MIKVNDYKAQNIISHPLKKAKHSEVNSDYTLISLKSEVFRLNSELNLEKSKQEILVAQNPFNFQDFKLTTITLIVNNEHRVIQINKASKDL